MMVISVKMTYEKVTPFNIDLTCLSSSKCMCTLFNISPGSRMNLRTSFLRWLDLHIHMN